MWRAEQDGEQYSPEQIAHEIAEHQSEIDEMTAALGRANTREDAE